MKVENWKWGRECNEEWGEVELEWNEIISGIC